jgi:PKD repeat protein
MEKKMSKIKRISLLCYIALIVLTIFLGYCKKAILTAPENATLVVSVNPTVIPLGGQAIVTVVGYKASGTPVPDGTVIFFSTDIGTIEARKETQNGTTAAQFQSNDNRSGVATITITSGNALVTPDPVTITIGSYALFSLSLSASPPVLPIGGGTAAIRVTAYDEGLNPLANIPVTLSTNAGQLNSSGSVITTGSNGIAEDLLQTSVTAVVTAASGNIETSITVNVETNESPTASFVYSPTSPKVEEKVNFNASESSDTDGTIISYSWDFGDGRTGSGITTTHKYKNAGTYTVVLVVQDNTGNRGSTNQTVSVSEGEAPNASFVYSPASPMVNETIHFNASESSDTDGSIVSYDWDLGDGNTNTGQTITHQYSNSGTYTVLLVVTDNDGNTASTTQSISVGENESPVASFIYSPTNPAINEEIYFNASDSYDPDGTIISYEWDFGDNSTDSGSTVTHQYSSSGTYTVHLRVTDNSGNTGSTTKDVTVSTSQSPTAVFIYSPSNPEVGENVYFNASESTDPDGTITSYQWDFGDGSLGSGITITHSFSDSGTYTVILTVTDDKGNQANVSKTVTVSENSAPTASFVYSPSKPKVNETVYFNASASSDPDGTIDNYEWDFGDGSKGSTVSSSHQYTTSGTYTVVLVVTDNSGNKTSTSQTVTVSS